MTVLSIMDNITKKRKEMGITQKELASLIGVSESAISKWKSGDNEPSMKNLKKIADVLNCSMSELTEGIMPLTGFESESDIIGAANDAPEEKDSSLSAPLTPKELSNFVRLLHEDRDFRVLCRTYGKVTLESCEQLQKEIREMKGESDGAY